jgi:hypothetical protein
MPPARYCTHGEGGESEAHRRLKLYVARHPALLDLRPDAVFEMEHEFGTGDRVCSSLSGRYRECI